MESLLSRVDAAAFLGMKPQTLAVWESTGRYELRMIKVGGRAKYAEADLEEFVERRATLPAKKARGWQQ